MTETGDIATLLRVARAAVGISQSDFAQIAGIERVRLSEFEHGRRLPAEQMAVHLLTTLGRLVCAAADRDRCRQVETEYEKVLSERAGAASQKNGQATLPSVNGNAGALAETDGGPVGATCPMCGSTNTKRRQNRLHGQFRAICLECLKRHKAELPRGKQHRAPRLATFSVGDGAAQAIVETDCGPVGVTA